MAKRELTRPYEPNPALRAIYRRFFEKIQVDEAWVRSVRNLASEGSIVYGLGLALTERISIKDGVVQQSNFYDYRVPRLRDVPEMHVKLMRTANPPTGVGQPRGAVEGAVQMEWIARALLVTIVASLISSSIGVAPVVAASPPAHSDAVNPATPQRGSMCSMRGSGSAAKYPSTNVRKTRNEANFNGLRVSRNA